jgi:hypothetical protein
MQHAVGLSPFFVVRQHFDSHKLSDIPDAVHRTLSESGMAARLKPGSEVAIGVGSRGIANIDTIVAAAVAWWKGQGMRPFLFPAMGSHGAATSVGQAAVLAKYGITEASMGCPVRSSLAVAELGLTSEGIPVVMDRTAYRAAGVMLCGRVKWHTDFAGALESGLFKMMAIGLGKVSGAKTYHTFATRMGLQAPGTDAPGLEASGLEASASGAPGLERMIRSVGRQVLGSGHILGGLAILEDANHDSARVEAVPAASMEQREEQLLALAKNWMPVLPAAFDVVIVNEMGKNFSGSGLDTKVINRAVWGDVNPWPGVPRVGRVFVRDLSPLSYGNATGIGLADVVHRRILGKIRRQPTYVNALTSSQPGSIRTPIHFPTDRECLRAVCGTVGRLDPADVTMGWIANTLDLGLMACTANLRGELETNPRIEILGEARALEFDERGDLVDWLGVW